MGDRLIKYRSMGCFNDQGTVFEKGVVKLMLTQALTHISQGHKAQAQIT